MIVLCDFTCLLQVDTVELSKSVYLTPRFVLLAGKINLEVDGKQSQMRNSSIHAKKDIAHGISRKPL